MRRRLNVSPADLYRLWRLGYTVPQLADRFGLPTTTIKSRLDRYRLGETSA